MTIKKIREVGKKIDSDRHVKRFKTKDHLINILFCSFADCNSRRYISAAVLGLSGKTESFQLSQTPKRSTLAVVNKNRKVDFFEAIYNKMLVEYGSVLSDSQIQDVLQKQVKIADSTAITCLKIFKTTLEEKQRTEQAKMELKLIL